MDNISLFVFNDKQILKEFEKRRNPNIKILKINRITISDLESFSAKKVLYTVDKKISCMDLNKFKNYKNVNIYVYYIRDLQHLNDIFSSIIKNFIHTPQDFVIRKVLPDAYGQLPYIKSFIRCFLLKNSDIKLTDVNKSLFRNRIDINIDVILSDINYLEQKGILTSRLAIFIFKITTFNYTANDREIGQFFAGYYCQRSKNYTCKQYDIRNTKGYAISDFDPQYAIKAAIAQNLIRNPNCSCDINCLAQAIGLSVDQLYSLR